jgi:hypothetical protein
LDLKENLSGFLLRWYDWTLIWKSKLNSYALVASSDESAATQLHGYYRLPELLGQGPEGMLCDTILVIDGLFQYCKCCGFFLPIPFSLSFHAIVSLLGESDHSFSRAANAQGSGPQAQ